jgi:5-methylcytosine-specific restriction protein A
VDHVIPVAEGGPDSEENMAPICDPCHGEKIQEEARRGRANALQG